MIGGAFFPTWLIAASLTQAGASDTPERGAAVQALIQQDRLTEARAQIEAGLKLQPNDPSLLNLLGIVDGRSGNIEGSERAFLRALKQVPGSVNIQMNLARLYQENIGRNPEFASKAIALYRRTLRAQPANSEARYQLAFLLVRQAECKDAMEQLRAFSPRQLEAPQAVAIAAACAERDERRKAVESLRSDPRLTVEDVLGILPTLERQGRYDEGKDLLESAAQRRGASAQVSTSLARLAYEKKDYKAALGYLGRARDLAPGDAGIHFFYGMTAVALNLVLEAKNSLAEAVRLAPDNPYYQYALGAVLSEQRDADAAIQHFQRYCDLRPQDPRGRFGIAVAYFQSNQLDKAAGIFQGLAGTRETAAGAHYFLGRIAKAENRLAEAESELLLAIKAAPSNLDAQAELGHVYLRQGKVDLAESALNGVIAKDPGHYLANLTLLGLYQRKRDPRAVSQKEQVEKLQAARKEKESELWRTVEFRPY